MSYTQQNVSKCIARAWSDKMWLSHIGGYYDLKTHTTLAMFTFRSYHREDGTGTWKPWLPGCRIVYFQQLSRSWTLDDTNLNHEHRWTVFGWTKNLWVIACIMIIYFYILPMCIVFYAATSKNVIVSLWVQMTIKHSWMLIGLSYTLCHHNQLIN